MMTLALLLTAATGAWAEETPLFTIASKGNTSFTSGSKTFGGMVTVTFSNSVLNYGDSDGWFSGGTESLLTVAGTNGYTITSCKFYTESGAGYTGYTVPGESPSVYLFSKTVYTDANKSVKIGERGIVAIEVYGGVAPEYREAFEALCAEEAAVMCYRGVKNADEAVETLRGQFALLFPTY